MPSTTTTLLTVLSTLSVASAHFSVSYPYWRGDSYATQWNYPCGGVDQSLSANNRTAWPLDGGSIVFAPSHDWAQTYVNLGLGNEVTRLNVPLVGAFNQTGKGTFCWNKVPIPESIRANVTEGVNATLQIIQLSTSGGALYNCMDITFTKEAELLDDEACFNSTDVGAGLLAYDGPSATTDCDAKDGDATDDGDVPETSAPAEGAGARFGFSSVALGAAVVVAALMA